MTETTLAPKAELGGKYLTFYLGSEEYGLEILKVQEIIGLMDITPLPGTPEAILGVINLRGKVIPVMDLRRKFSMDDVEHTKETCIIVVKIEGVEMGIVVDRVSEVADIASADIEDAPAFGASVDVEYILGIGKAGNGVKLLLDIDCVVDGEDLERLRAKANAAAAN